MPAQPIQPETSTAPCLIGECVNEKGSAAEMMRPELAGIDIGRMNGLEIGPLASPRVRKDEGPIRYLDHASTVELRRKYASDAGMRGRLDEIVDVDYVVGAHMTIADAVDGDAPFDYVIASHVIEHIPDPVGWLAEVAQVLRPGGILALVIPDKRYCFDINRSLTEISDLIDANLRHLRQPSYRQAYDFYSKAIGGIVDTAAVWAGVADYSSTVRQDFDDPDIAALDACRRMQSSDEFVDVHCSVFTPDSFLTLFDKLARLDLIDFELASLHPTVVNTMEFNVNFRKLDSQGDRSKVRAAQLASLARVRTQHPGATVASPATRSAHVGMVVSPLEARAIVLKRRSLARLRLTLKWIRHFAQKP
jgi:SAM-dependent methyltransferase